MGLFDALDASGSALSAERVRMDVTAENLANAQSTRTANGQGPYRRKEVVLQEAGAGVGSRASFADSLRAARGVKVAGIVEDDRPHRRLARVRGQRHGHADDEDDVRAHAGHPQVTLPIDTSFLTSGADWNVGSVDGSAGAGAGAGGVAPSGGGSGFGSMLTDQLDKLEGVQNDAAKASQDLATGQATDPEAVVMAVERARLSMQLASTLRSKAVEAVNDVFHTQV